MKLLEVEINQVNEVDEVDEVQKTRRKIKDLIMKVNEGGDVDTSFTTTSKCGVE